MKPTIAARILISVMASSFSCSVLADTEADVIKSMSYNPKITLEHKLVAFDGGFLGFDGGEWGGALIFLDKRGRATEVVSGNINGIARAGRQVLVFSGLAHLGVNTGKIVELTQMANAAPVAHDLIDLQGAPLDIRQVNEQTISFRVLTSFDHGKKMADVCKLYSQGVVSKWNGCKIASGKSH